MIQSENESTPTLHPSRLNGAELAYLGDAVLELMAREAAVSGYVRATAQSDACARIEGMLTEEELAVFKRGRNSHNLSVPKSASAAQYRRATGLEALFAALYLEGKRDRLRALFAAAYPAQNPPES